MQTFFRTLVLAFGMMLAPWVQAEDSWTLGTAKETFSNAKAGSNSVSILHDGWHIVFLAHDGSEIGAVIIRAQKSGAEHEYDLEETISRVAEVVGMDAPESLTFEDEEEAGLLVDQTVLSSLSEKMDNVFAGSPLAAMAYLLNEEYFIIHGIRENGYLHWKTAKKSGVDLLMPMDGRKLSAIEITGRQQMNEFAAEVLADKLGLGKNNVQGSVRNSVGRQLNCDVVSYMNSKNNILLAGKANRRAVGKRIAVGQMLANRNYEVINFAEQESDWPSDEEEEKAEDESEEEEAEEPEDEKKPLTPAAAKEAYIEYIKSI